jgi:hypothetical protein
LIGIAQAGLEEITSDISKLVNLRVLSLEHSRELFSIPEAISCLQNMQTLHIEGTSITQVPLGLATLQNLRSLSIKDANHIRHQPLKFPSCLKVTHFPWCSLVSVDIGGGQLLSCREQSRVSTNMNEPCLTWVSPDLG